MMPTVMPDITSPNNNLGTYWYSHVRMGRRPNRNLLHSLQVFGGVKWPRIGSSVDICQ